MDNPFEQFLKIFVGAPIFHFNPATAADLLTQNRKIKAFALLYWPKEIKKNRWGIKKTIEPSDVHLGLVAAFDLEEAEREFVPSFSFAGKNKDDFFLAKWAVLDYDQLFPALAGIQEKFEAVKLVEKEKLKEEVEVKTPPEQFIYNIRLLADKVNANTIEKQVVEQLIKRFEDIYYGPK